VWFVVHLQPKPNELSMENLLIILIQSSKSVLQKLMNLVAATATKW
jgi:hypothetical protein